MMALTHGAIGVVSFAGLSALFGGAITPAALGAAAVGSWLPDVDTPNSKAGMCVYPLAAWLEKRFGHRTITHSATGVFLFALLISPLLIWAISRPIFVPLLLGYVFHLLGDAATKAGVPLAWPRRERFVFPGNSQWRLTTGSGAEWGVLCVVFVLALVTLPVSQLGPRRLLHMFSGDIRGATRDVQDWSANWEVEAEIEGFDVLRKKVVEGRFRVVGLRGDDGLLIEREGGALWLVSKMAGEADPFRIEPRRVRVYNTRRVETRQVTLTARNITLAALSNRLKAPIEKMPPPWETPASEDFRVDDIRVSGVADCYKWAQGFAAPKSVPQAPGLKRADFATTSHRLTLRDLPPNSLLLCGQAAIKSASFVVQLPRKMPAPKLDFPSQTRVVVVPHLRQHADLSVKVGQIVTVGTALGRPFGQTFKPDLSGEIALQMARAEAAKTELLALDAEEGAMRESGLWSEFASSFAQRRQSLTRMAKFAPPAPVTEKPAPPVLAPFGAVVEAVEWEVPTTPTRPGEIAEHRARVTLSEVMTR